MRSTSAVSVSVVPAGVRHDMVNTVSPVIGTVAAPPDNVFSVKFPAELVMVHESTPCVFQNIEVLPPSGTRAGDAQISTFGSMTGPVGVGT